MKLLFLACVYVLLATSLAAGQEQTSPDWRSYDLPFRVLNITSTGQLLWVCGTDETIAVSSDNGAHWQVKHQTVDGALLLNIDFADSKFGYAAGTGGLILTTVDGGETWVPHSGISETILQISLSDLQHGLVRTPTSTLSQSMADCTGQRYLLGRIPTKSKTFLTPSHWLPSMAHTWEQ